MRQVNAKKQAYMRLLKVEGSKLGNKLLHPKVFIKPPWGWNRPCDFDAFGTNA